MFSLSSPPRCGVGCCSASLFFFASCPGSVWHQLPPIVCLISSSSSSLPPGSRLASARGHRTPLPDFFVFSSPHCLRLRSAPVLLPPPPRHAHSRRRPPRPPARPSSTRRIMKHSAVVVFSFSSECDLLLLSLSNPLLLLSHGTVRVKCRYRDLAWPSSNMHTSVFICVFVGESIYMWVCL